ncbi:DNA polymerase I [Candidatus Magnetomoraceae bacterium gMMP-15]
MKKTVYLIDGSSYIHRAYHAIGHLFTSKGFPSNAVFGFTKMLIKLIKDKKPEYAAMVFDSKGPTFRHEMYEAYKANRSSMPEDMVVQLPFIKKISKAFNMPVVEMQGYEADDLIGTLARQSEKNDFHVIIVSGDKDFIQLITDKAIIWDPMRDSIRDKKTIKDKYEIEPIQFIDMMGLWGDRSDNIPGVPGIGEKTACSLIKSFGSIDNIYENIETITKKKQKENLIKYKDAAYLSRRLVSIDTESPVSFDSHTFKIQEPDYESLSKLFKELEFQQLQQIIPTKTDLREKDYQAILDLSSLDKLISELRNAGRFSLDTETTSTDPMMAKLVGISFSFKANQAFYIPTGHYYLGAPSQLDLQEVLTRLKPILEDPALKKIGQNIKYDWMVLKRYNINLKGVFFDTMLASYLLDPSRQSHGLNRMALDFLGHKMITFQDVAGKGKNACLFSEVFLEDAVPYACEDADITLIIYEILQKKLKEIGLKQLFKKVEMPLVPVLIDMEMRGVKVDKDYLYKLSKNLESQLYQLQEKIYDFAGEPFNIQSPKQLGYILFDKLKFPAKKKTKKKTGYSTDINVLALLAKNHAFPALILRYRSLAKLKSTYTDALMQLIHPETGRIHTSYNQTVTATGRLSSSNPNLQNIPIRTDEGREIRRAFIPKENTVFLSADYSQIELRVLAHYANDPILIDSFKKNEDIHTRTASEVLNMPPDIITREMRTQAKAINFGIIYGMGAFKLSKELGITNKMAQIYINNYFDRYKKVKQFIEDTIAKAHEEGKITTLLKRIRLLPNINSTNKRIQAMTERMAVNTVIQGTAADLIKLAMIRVFSALKQENLKSAMLLTVHDEIILEVMENELKKVKSIVREIMENIWNLRVPLKVNMDVGKNWAEAH